MIRKILGCQIIYCLINSTFRIEYYFCIGNVNYLGRKIRKGKSEYKLSDNSFLIRVIYVQNVTEIDLLEKLESAS